MELRPEDITEIVRIFNDSELVELRLEIGGHRLYLSKQAGGGPAWEVPASPPAGSPASPASPAGAPSASPGGAAPASSGAAPVAPASGDDVETAVAPAVAPAVPPASAPGSPAVPGPGAGNLIDLNSPLLGVFYRRPAPDQPPFVEVGSEVGPDDPVCIIDVMKMFSRVPAGAAGRVAEILVEDGQLVEHGQVLMRLEPR